MEPVCCVRSVCVKDKHQESHKPAVAGLLRADCKPSRRGKLIRPCYLSESCSVGVGFCQRKGRRVKLTSYVIRP